MSSSVFPENMEPQITSMQPDFFVFSKNICVPLFCVITHAKIALYGIKSNFMAGILYIVPTPVGNLEDMTLRAIRVLKEADLILAEDTRTTSVLLKHYDIHRPLQSHHKYNEHQTVELVKERILGGLNVALVSDAGTPGISDPGFLLARTCAEEGIEVQTLPGATACIPAIVSSGLPCDRFAFEGFLTQKKGRQTLLQSLAEETRTMLFYESPYRLVKTLEQFIQYFGPERRCSVAREISKLHEEHKRGTLAEVVAWFREHEPKGEIVIVVAGAQPAKPSKQKRYGRGEEETQQP
jgi:16S rRNA (cytidine1402-2'-O)-methyltransferase